mgnify:CR=1 FL=1
MEDKNEDFRWTKKGVHDWLYKKVNDVHKFYLAPKLLHV